MIPDMVAPAPTAPQTSTDAGSHAPGKRGAPRDAAAPSLGHGAQNAARAPAAAAVVSQSALRLPATLDGASGARTPVDVRLLGPVGDVTVASATRGLVATVIGNSAASGVLLDLAGQRLRLAGPRVHLPLGARLALELLPAGGGPPIRDKAGLAGLTAARQPVVGSGQQPALPPAAAVPDATLAARLVVDWRALGGAKASGKPAQAGNSVTIAVGDDAMSSATVDRENGSRASFGLLAAPGTPAQPFALWRRDRTPQAPDEAGDHLLLTLDLSRLGRITLEMWVDRKRLQAAIRSPIALPTEVRESLAQSIVAAAEIAGREPALVFLLAAAGAPPPVSGAIDA
jgi:hypothetical protein